MSNLTQKDINKRPEDQKRPDNGSQESDVKDPGRKMDPSHDKIKRS